MNLSQYLGGTHGDEDVPGPDRKARDARHYPRRLDGLDGQKMQGVPSIDALDPFGGLETMMKFIAGGEFIKKIEPGTVVLFGAVVALGIVLSRFFCGWFCSFGALQAVFGWLGKKIFKRRFTVPKKLDSFLRWLKYPVLAAIIYFTWTTASLVIRPYDPLAAFGHLSAGLPAVWAEFTVGLIILVVILVLSMLYERVFCKYLCPLGAVNAILSRIPIFRIKRIESTCISCSKCDKSCPMNIDVSKPEAVTSPECISCMECVTACPTKKPSLVASLGGKAVKLGVIVAIGFGISLGAAAVGQALGMLRFSAPSLKELSSSGTINVADIKGSSTYEMVAESFGIELERLYREVGIDMKKVPPSTMLKDTGKLAGIDGFEADAVRVAVAKILGLPYAGEKGEAEPSATAAPAAVDSKKAGEAIAPAASAKAPVSRTAPKPSARSEKPAVAAESAALVVPEDFELEGTMSIQDISAELNASNAIVIKKLGLPADIPTDKPLREMKDTYGYSMPDLKVKIKE
jgi:ferredoxin